MSGAGKSRGRDAKAVSAVALPGTLNADGEASIEGTRYTVKHIAAEQYFFGWSAEEILRQHPDLRPAEIYAALAYFHD